MTVLVVGATAGLGRALSEALARAGHDLLLAASDHADLDVQARHLRTVYGVAVGTVKVDAGSVDSCLNALRKGAAELTEVDGLCFPIGGGGDVDDIVCPAAEIDRLLSVNLRCVMAIVSEFLPQMLERGDGFVVGFGSIAAIRGRRANVIYSAAKRGLASYFESLRHGVVGSRIRVHFYSLGYVDTGQTFGRSLLFPPASAQSVARAVLQDLQRDSATGFSRNGGSRYLPRYWSLIACAVSLLPWALYKRLDF